MSLPSHGKEQGKFEEAFKVQYSTIRRTIHVAQEVLLEIRERREGDTFMEELRLFLGIGNGTEPGWRERDIV